MRRADRLFQIVQILRHRRLTTAATLADRLQVSERTIYRDVRDLSVSGVPVQGEAGVGYRLGKDFDLPPLMFDKAEIQALVLGARMVESWGDAQLRSAAQSVLEKVEAALPPADRGRLHNTALFSVSFHVPKAVRNNLPPLRKAIDEQRRLQLRYLDAKAQPTNRVVRPLGLYFWGNRWTVGAWCELREDFRTFRVDRIDDATPLADRFKLEPPVTLDGYVRAMADD